MSAKEKTLLECDVCFDKYNSDSKSPRLLLCGHTFCTECVTHLATSGVVVCPNCRQRTSVGMKGIKELKKNFALISLLDTLHKFELGTICDECEETKAERWCDACAASFCSRCCTSVHKRALKHHKHVVLKDKAIATCETHKRENLSFFCLKCEVPICNICRDKEYGEHGSHKVNLVDKVEDDQRKKLVEKRSEIKENVSSLEELSKLVSETSTTLKSNEESVANLINSTFAALIASMEERKSKLLQENKSKCQSSNDKLKKQRLEIASLVADFSVLSEEYARASSRKGVSLLLQLKSLSSRANTLDMKYEKRDRAPVGSADVSCELPKNQILDPLKRFGSIDVISNKFEVTSNKFEGISNNFDVLITKCEKVTSTSLKLFWKAKTRSRDVVKYIVQQRVSEEKQSADGGWKEVKRTKSTSETISSLVNNSSYDFRVCGLSERMKEPGSTGWGSVKTFKTAKDEPKAVWVVKEVHPSLSLSNNQLTIRLKNFSGSGWVIGNEVTSPKALYLQIRCDYIRGFRYCVVGFADKTFSTQHKYPFEGSVPQVWAYETLTGRISVFNEFSRKGNSGRMRLGETLGTLVDLKKHAISWDIDGKFMHTEKCDLESGRCVIGVFGRAGQLTVTNVEWRE